VARRLDSERRHSVLATVHADSGAIRRSVHNDFAIEVAADLVDLEEITLVAEGTLGTAHPSASNLAVRNTEAAQMKLSVEVDHWKGEGGYRPALDTSELEAVYVFSV
jgi:hypothetical protein